jgi:prolyl-tRNA editing enzyme YbaK/EbsC (Cys-tRNA(Pro) deacylase)
MTLADGSTAPPAPGPGRDLSTHPAVARVLGALDRAAVSTTVRYLPDAVRTAAAAAEALGVTPAEIANSLVFSATDLDGRTDLLLVLASGGHRVDLDKVATLAGLARLDRADPETVRERTGFAIGGVAPVGHLTPLRTVVDVTLDRYDAVWAAAGHSHAVFRTSYAELLRMTVGQPMEVV